MPVVLLLLSVPLVQAFGPEVDLAAIAALVDTDTQDAADQGGGCCRGNDAGNENRRVLNLALLSQKLSRFDVVSSSISVVFD